jgi:hypothetical protein
MWGRAATTIAKSASGVRTVGELLDGLGHLVAELDSGSICAGAALRIGGKARLVGTAPGSVGYS